jgi:hypothetical protein
MRATSFERGEAPFASFEGDVQSKNYSFELKGCMDVPLCVMLLSLSTDPSTDSILGLFFLVLMY